MPVAAVAQYRRRMQRGHHDRPGLRSTPADEGGGRACPRCVDTRKAAPSKDCAAVAPRHTITCGRTASISAMSQGRHATTSVRLGF